jgi:hypothetical protein
LSPPQSFSEDGVMRRVSTSAFQVLTSHIAGSRSGRTSNHAASFLLFLFSALLFISCGVSAQGQRFPNPMLRTRSTELDDGDADGWGPARRTRLITISADLPRATVGAAYNARISLRGGIAPYYLSIVRRRLPVGLTLNSRTGRISGKARVAGSYAFVVRATDSTDAHFGVKRLTLVVAEARTDSDISVHISPAYPTVSSGGTAQFTATVRKTSNVAVTWSATAGTISRTGLFAAPVVKIATTATVTAISVADPSKKASTTVLVTASVPTPAPGPTITSTSVPPATVGVAYLAALAASGGQLPYTWSIASGALPQVLQLTSASGSISGVPSQSGTFSFTARVTDGSGQTAQQSIPIVVSAAEVPPAATCTGTAPYPCACTDLTTIQLPNPLPNFGNQIGANTLVSDPEPSNGTTCFHSPIVRVTDAHTNNAKSYVTYNVGTGGSGDENVWNVNSTLLMLGDTGGTHYPFSFNPTTMQAARLYATGTQGSGMTIGHHGSWSYVNSQVWFALNTSAGAGGLAQILSYDFTNRVTPPTPSLLADFKSGGNALATNYSITWSVAGFNSKDDLTFLAGFSNTGTQNTGCDVVAWRSGSGFSHLNTCTGTVTGDFGSAGAIGIADRWTIHNVKISKDGTTAIISRGACETSCSNGHSPYEWTIGTTTVGYLAQIGQQGGGHFTEGYTHWVNNSPNILLETIRTFASPGSSFGLIPTAPVSGAAAPLDQHQGWANTKDDTQPFLLTTTSATKPFPSASYNEVQAIDPRVGTVWRFAHTYTNQTSQRFDTRNGIGGVSQDGNFYAWSSDVIGTLGSESGASTCTLGINCRGDVFIVNLSVGAPSAP